MPSESSPTSAFASGFEDAFSTANSGAGVREVTAPVAPASAEAGSAPVAEDKKTRMARLRREAAAKERGESGGSGATNTAQPAETKQKVETVKTPFVLFSNTTSADMKAHIARVVSEISPRFDAKQGKKRNSEALKRISQIEKELVQLITTLDDNARNGKLPSKIQRDTLGSYLGYFGYQIRKTELNQDFKGFLVENTATNHQQVLAELEISFSRLTQNQKAITKGLISGAAVGIGATLLSQIVPEIQPLISALRIGTGSFAAISQLPISLSLGINAIASRLGKSSLFGLSGYAYLELRNELVEKVTKRIPALQNSSSADVAAFMSSFSAGLFMGSTVTGLGLSQIEQYQANIAQQPESPGEPIETATPTSEPTVSPEATISGWESGTIEPTDVVPATPEQTPTVETATTEPTNTATTEPTSTATPVVKWTPTPEATPTTEPTVETQPTPYPTPTTTPEPPVAPQEPEIPPAEAPAPPTTGAEAPAASVSGGKADAPSESEAVADKTASETTATAPDESAPQSAWSHASSAVEAFQEQSGLLGREVGVTDFLKDFLAAEFGEKSVETLPQDQMFNLIRSADVALTELTTDVVPPGPTSEQLARISQATPFEQLVARLNLDGMSGGIARNDLTPGDLSLIEQVSQAGLDPKSDTYQQELAKLTVSGASALDKYK